MVGNERNIFLIESLHLEVDKKIFDNRRKLEIERAHNIKKNSKVYPLNFSENSEYFKDFIFFLENDIDGVLLIEIFNIFSKHNILNVPSVPSDRHPQKDNNYDTYGFARKDNLYNHIIVTAKSIIVDEDIKKHGDSFVNSLIFFVLLHDIGKIPTLNEDFNWIDDWPSSTPHEKLSALVAQSILTKENYKNKYKDLLKSFYDWHWDKTQKQSDDLYGYYLDLFDQDNRKKNEKEQIQKVTKYDS